MRLSRALLLVSGLLTALPAFAVYAPVPVQEASAKDLSVTIRGGLSYDTNLFGSPTNTVETAVWELAPRLNYMNSVTPQTFLAAGYGLTLNQFQDRPGDKFLDSHDAQFRVAHAFTKTTNIDVNNLFILSRNPESLLAGVPLNPDQSFLRNQLDGRFATVLGPKVGAALKARTVYYDYRNAILARAIDRTETLLGATADYAILPELKGVGEYRHQEVYYRKLGETKNKSSDYLMAGLDYDVARKFSVSSRFGAEWRERASEASTTAPYVELSGKYDYAETSYLASGYAFTFDETSDTARFTDSKVHRFFVNVEHRLTALIVLSGSFSYENAVLQGRRIVADVDEESVRTGVALSYLPTKNWMLSASYDFDQIFSEEAARDMKRQRTGLSATYSF